jgi:monothiol glutaredoxin
MNMDDTMREEIKTTIEASRVVLFMKGSKSFPQCGFSARVVQILKEVGTEFKDVNVLSNPDLREGLKEFSSWPTFPQLYVGGELVGGCDIVVNMFESGELKKLIDPA